MLRPNNYSISIMQLRLRTAPGSSSGISSVLKITELSFFLSSNSYFAPNSVDLHIHPYSQEILLHCFARWAKQITTASGRPKLWECIS